MSEEAKGIGATLRLLPGDYINALAGEPFRVGEVYEVVGDDLRQRLGKRVRVVSAHSADDDTAAPEA